MIVMSNIKPVIGTVIQLPQVEQRRAAMYAQENSVGVFIRYYVRALIKNF
jgi:hypothetical protein